MVIAGQRCLRRLGSILGIACVVACAPNTREVDVHAYSGILLTNQQLIEATHALCGLESEIGFFDVVFNKLPDTVTVYPSENYYYFEMICDGRIVRGNIRLDVRDRDRGIIHFAYHNVGNDEAQHYRVFDSRDGMLLTRISGTIYKMSFHGRTVIFELPNVPQVPCEPLRSEEQYIGTLMDESGIAFMLLYVNDVNDFKYLLCKNLPHSTPLRLMDVSTNVRVDGRTGFAFFRDGLTRDRLIGIRARDTLTNTYFDGPFDQLPENHIRGSTFRVLIETAYPGYRGLVDDYGNLSDDMRVVISPYVHYVGAAELATGNSCEPELVDDKFFDCFKSAVRASRGPELPSQVVGTGAH